MKKTSQMTTALHKAGIAVPPFPARRLPVQERHLQRGARVPQEELDADEEQRVAVAQWKREIARLYDVLKGADQKLEEATPTS